MSNPKEGSKLKVGFIGLGRMGQGMSKRILDAGNDVVVYDVIPAATKLLGDVGATIAPTVSDACKGRDVVITMLAEDYVVKEVILGKGGVRDSLPAGSIHLAMGTYSIPTIRTIEAEHNKAGPVAVIDTDPQGSLASWWNTREAPTPLFAAVNITQLGEHLVHLRR